VARGLGEMDAVPVHVRRRVAAERGEVEVVPEGAFRPVEPKPLGSHHEVDDVGV
jgi:hypothetical protein